jgi:dynein heavy chain
MKSEWRNVKFELALFRDTGTYILKAVEPILDRLDEDIAKTQTIATSPFVTFFQQEVNNQRTTLYRIQETIELWCKLQKSWLYLQPIFFSDDIVREMPTYGSKYQQVDRQWRAIMQNTHTLPLVNDACFQTRLKENFQMMIEQLDQVIKGLNDFLNRKRSAFPRFFFLSNEELLQILA